MGGDESFTSRADKGIDHGTQGDLSDRLKGKKVMIQETGEGNLTFSNQL